MLSIEAEIFLDLHNSSHVLSLIQLLMITDSRQIWIQINYF